jgi:predicted DNA binding CopG/RHH family protein
MRKRKNYVKSPAALAGELENAVALKDHLLSPGAIAESLKKQKTIPVTMNLKKDTLERYKKFAAKERIKYQSFVSAVLDMYSKHLRFH